MASYINPPPNQNLVLENNHPLIRREDNYLLDRKLLTIHSEDRDYSKWRFANEFEIEAPQSYTNIQSARLIDINFPCNYYNFSNIMQNTKFRIIITDISAGSVPVADLPLKNFNYDITIDNGYYTNLQLAASISFHLNKILGVKNQKIDEPPLLWKAVYHEVKQKILIGNNFGAQFILDGTFDFDYNNVCCDIHGTGLNCPPPNKLAPSTINYYKRYSKWGFLSYIGFNKKEKYESTPIDYSLNDASGMVLNYIDSCQCQDFIWLESVKDYDIYFIEPPTIIDILGETVIYMELEYFNSYDELIPWPDTSGNTNCAPKCARSANDVLDCDKNTNRLARCRKGPKYPDPDPPPGFARPEYVAIRGSGVNSAFAKIPLISIPKTQIFSSANGFLFNLTQFTPPLERVSKFKIKFRYHDGRLVDFKDNELNFTLEINQLRNEFNRNLNIRMPKLYNIT